MRFLRQCTVLFFAGLLSACLTPADQTKDAEAIVQQLHEAMMQQDWDRAVSLYHPSFFAELDREAWRAHLARIVREHGKLLRVEKVFSQKDARLQADYYIFSYRLHFSRGTLQETITVGKGVNENELRILAHRLQP